MSVKQVTDKEGRKRVVNTRIEALIGVWVCKKCGNFCGKILHSIPKFAKKRGFCKQCDEVVDQIVLRGKWR